MNDVRVHLSSPLIQFELSFIILNKMLGFSTAQKIALLINRFYLLMHDNFESRFGRCAKWLKDNKFMASFFYVINYLI